MDNDMMKMLLSEIEKLERENLELRQRLGLIDTPRDQVSLSMLRGQSLSESPEYGRSSIDRTNKTLTNATEMILKFAKSVGFS